MKTKLQIIDETVKYIEKNGRGLDQIGFCAYKTEINTGCAVGRCLDYRKYNRGFEGKSVWILVQDILDKELDYYLKKDYKGHELGFWSDLQRLHDSPSFWIGGYKHTIISQRGEDHIETLKQKWS